MKHATDTTEDEAKALILLKTPLIRYAIELSTRKHPPECALGVRGGRPAEAALSQANARFTSAVSTKPPAMRRKPQKSSLSGGQAEHPSGYLSRV